MKSGEAKRKQPTKEPVKASSRAGAVRAEKESPRVQQTAPPRAEQPRVEQPRVAATSDGMPPVPDLSKHGISESDAREHLRRCETCGPAHRHVAKNPKDAMALESFGRRVASCVATQPAKSHA